MAKSKNAALPQAISKTVALQDLRAGDGINARRSGRDTALDELKASILAHGVVQSLRVRLVGGSHYEVIAGNRRLLALQKLMDEGKIDGEFLVPVIVSVIDDDASAHELSVVENVERVPVSPIDEFRAFGRLIDEGRTPEDVAERFGVPVRRVQQRMKLAGLHPDLLAALDQGQLTLDAAQAFTIAPPERQAAKFKEWMDGGQVYNLRYGDNVRSALVREHVRGDSELAQLIGEEAYLAAGGEIVQDLFQDKQYWISGSVIAQLVDAAWAERVAEWLSAGWAWAKPASEVPDVYSRIRVYPSTVPLSDDDAARLAVLEAELEEFDTDNGLDDNEEAEWGKLDAEADALRAKTTSYSAEDMAKAGVVYWADSGRVEFGVGEPSSNAGSSSGAPAPKASALSPEDPAAVGPTVSETLSNVLSDALRTEVAADPELALPLLASFMAASQGGRTLPAHLNVGHASGTDREGSQSIAEAFMYFEGLAEKELLAAIARMFANTLDVGDTFLTSTKFVHVATRPKLVAELVGIVQPRDFPEFDAVAYFAGVKKPLIAAAFKEITGDAIKDGKKADMAATTAKLAVAQGWLPVVLRNATYEGPGSAVTPIAEAAE